MGREVLRVPIDFDWPINLPWKGFVSPYSGQKCLCDGSGKNPETTALENAFYNGANGGWHCDITQDEVQALVDAFRLYDFTHSWTNNKWVRNDPYIVPTAEQVNELNRRGSFDGHDAVNRWILVETRAKRLGIWGDCKWCKGHGMLWCSERMRLAAHRWRRVPPPKGAGWQVWETVSEGSPITPVFATADLLIDYLVDGGDGWDRKRGAGGWTRENAKAFVERSFAMSLIIKNGKSIEPRDSAAI